MRSQTRIAQFQSRQEVYVSYYIPNGTGFVCESHAITISNYRFSTGIISSQSVISFTLGVQSAGNLSLHRRP